MKSGVISWFASRYLLKKEASSFVSLISWISIIGIMIAVGVLIVVLSVVNGFEKELESKLLIMSGHANIENTSGKISEWESQILKAEEHENVKKVIPYVQSQGLLVSQNKMSSVIFRGIDPSIISDEVPEFLNFITDGSLDEIKQGNFNVMLGSELAEYLDVSVGDTVNLNLANGITTPFGIFPRAKDFKVTGIFRVGMNEYDRNLIIVNMHDAKRLLRMGDTISGLRLSMNDMYEAKTTVRNVALSLGGNFLIRDWTQSHSNFFRSIQITKSILFIILLSVIAVAAFNIVSTLMMVVKDKQRDIAILRANGLSHVAILKIYILQGVMIGIIGTILGVTLGVIITSNLQTLIILVESIFGIKVLSSEVYFISDVPADLRFFDVILVSFIAFNMAVLSTIYPAWKASKIIPSEILRNEK
tara:strand:+ start:461 stop:1714 length:1254 start_codon:yes stop_codon:yes gene_type:complete